MSKTVTLIPLAKVTKVTVREAAAISQNVGSRICWRPDGYISRTQPELDTAEVLEG